MLNANEARAQYAACAALAQASRPLGVWSLLLCALSALALLTLTTASHLLAACWTIVLLLGPIERYFAFRLALDSHLFAALAAGEIATLADLDEALHALGLRAKSVQERALQVRMQGLRKIVVRHALVASSQTIVFFAALVQAHSLHS